LYFPQHRFSEDLDFSAQPGVLSADIDEAMQQAVRAAEQLLQDRGPFEVQWERLLLPEPIRAVRTPSRCAFASRLTGIPSAG
jgi:hypothetical protein